MRDELRSVRVDILRLNADAPFSAYQEPLSWLSKGHRARVLSYRRDADRVRALFARLLTGAALRRDHGRELTDFVYGAHGKPSIEAVPEFQFSLSHAANRVALVSAPWPVGVDVEPVRPFDERVAARFFTDAERAYMDARDDRQSAFFWLWTRKEAYVKATGEGMSRPFRSFDVLDSASFHTFFTEGYAVSVCAPAINPPSVHVTDAQELINRLKR